MNVDLMATQRQVGMIPAPVVAAKNSSGVTAEIGEVYAFVITGNLSLFYMETAA